MSTFKNYKQIKASYIIDKTDQCRQKRIKHFKNVSLLLEHIKTTSTTNRNQPLSFRILNQVQRSMLDLSKEAADFMWAQLALILLQELPPNKSSLDDMVAICTDFYYYDELELIIIDEFRRTYTANEALKWYSRPCFIFRLVNMILRIEDIDGLFAFRQFIIDLHMQIAAEHRKQSQSISNRRVYRGQRLTIDELEQFKADTGKLISMNSFFSTSTDRDVALLFIESANNDRNISALFVINVDMNLESTLCADISMFSMIPDEHEVLFSLSSVFRLGEVHHDEENDLWEIYLVATDEGRDHLAEYKQMMLDIEQEDNPYLLFGKLLSRRGLYEKAYTYYNSVSKIIPEDDWKTQVSLKILYGRSLFSQSKHEESLATFNRTLTLLESLGKGFESLQYLRCQFNIANVYMYTNQYESALKIYQQILNAQRKILPDNHFDIAESLSGVSWALALMGEIEQALQYCMQSLEIRQRILPECHPSIAHALRATGNYYDTLGLWSEAWNYYYKAHQMTVKYLPPTHPHHAISLLNLATVYENQNELDTALNNYLEALKIYDMNYKYENPAAIRTLNLIGNIHRKRKEFELAFKYIHKALNMRASKLTEGHLSFGDTFHCLAHIYLDTNDSTKAIEHFTKALEIKRRYLKETTQSVTRTMSCLATAFSHNGQYDLAKETFEKTLIMQEESHPNGHPDVGITMHHMASNFWRMNDHVNALEFYQKSLDMNRKFYAPTHMEITLVESKIQRLLNDKSEYCPSQNDV